MLELQRDWALSETYALMTASRDDLAVAAIASFA
jgi:hypothetical protein